MLAFAFIYTLHCADLCAVGTHSTKPEMLNDGCSVVFLTFLTWAFRRRKGSGKKYKHVKGWTSGGQTWKKSTKIRRATSTTRRPTLTCSGKAWSRILVQGAPATQMFWICLEQLYQDTCCVFGCIGLLAVWHTLRVRWYDEAYVLFPGCHGSSYIPLSWAVLIIMYPILFRGLNYSYVFYSPGLVDLFVTLDLP